MIRAIIIAAGLMVFAGHAAAEQIDGRNIRVIDGDTIAIGGERIRLVGYDTPETYNARCDYELALGNMATDRLRELLATGSTELLLQPGRDRYGRLLGRLFVNRVDVGDTLSSEGLARSYTGGRRQSWC